MALSINFLIIVYNDKTELLIRLRTEEVQPDIISRSDLGYSPEHRKKFIFHIMTIIVRLSEGILWCLLKKIIGMV